MYGMVPCQRPWAERRAAGHRRSAGAARDPLVGPGGDAPGREARPVLLGWAALTAATVLAWLLSSGESGSSAAVGDGAVVWLAVLWLTLLVTYLA